MLLLMISFALIYLGSIVHVSKGHWQRGNSLIGGNYLIGNSQIMSNVAGKYIFKC